MRQAAGGRLIGTLFHLHTQATVAASGRGPRDRAMEPHERHRDTAAGELDTFHDFGDDADLGVFAVAARHQKQLRVLAGVDGEGDRHAGEDHGVVERDQSEGRHEATIRLLFDDVNY